MEITTPAPLSAPSPSSFLLMLALASGALASIITLLVVGPAGIPGMSGPRGSAAAVLAVVSSGVDAYMYADSYTITAGQSTNLNASCRNSTSASIDQGIGSVDPVNWNVISVSPTQTTTYGLTCSNPSYSPSYALVSITITVTANQPDLTAGSVTVGGNPPHATAGTVANIQAVLSNLGDATTGTGFTSLLQKSDDPTLTNNVTDVQTTTLGSALAAGATANARFAYTFPAADAGTTKYLRVCADKSSAGSTGTITESNENNNCGAWTAVIVTAPSYSVSCSPSPATAAPNQSVTWTATSNVPSPTTYAWTVTGGTPDSASGSSNTFTTMFTSGGSYAPTVVVNPNTATALTGSCTPVAISGDPYTCAAAVTPVITATPGRLVAGNTTTIAWNASGITAATTCTISGPNVGGAGVNTTTSTPADSSCNIASGASNAASITITTQGVYTITCGATSKSVVVNVLPKFKEF